MIMIAIMTISIAPRSKKGVLHCLRRALKLYLGLLIVCSVTGINYFPVEFMWPKRFSLHTNGLELK